MEYLYAPWRDGYITREGEKIDGCVFCHISAHPERDEEQQVLFRDEHCFVVMNKYPYTPGHFMVIPHAHTDKLETLPFDHWERVSKRAYQGVKLLKEVFKVPGVNMGMNLGAVGGAGIAEHIHLHLVPRWAGDTNFMTTIGESRVYSTDFERIYRRLLEEAPACFID